MTRRVRRVAIGSVILLALALLLAGMVRGCLKVRYVEIQNLGDVPLSIDLNDGEQSLTVSPGETVRVVTVKRHRPWHVRAVTIEPRPWVYDLKYERNPNERSIKVRIGGPVAHGGPGTSVGLAASQTATGSPEP